MFDRKTIPVGPCYIFLEPSRQMGVEIQCAVIRNLFCFLNSPIAKQGKVRTRCSAEMTNGLIWKLKITDGKGALKKHR